MTTVNELAGQRLADEVPGIGLLGPMHYRAWLELVAEDHAYTFRTPYQIGYVPGECIGPDTGPIMWMARN
jgi:hypothetical protein